MCALFPKKRSEKNHPKVERGIKNVAKATKKLALMIFSFAKKLNKKKRKKRERDREVPLSINCATGSFESMHACHIEWLILQGRIYRPISSNFCHGCVFSGYSAAYESTKNYRQT